MKQVTSKEILEACQIQSAKTLTRWYQAGLIPSPEVGRMPDGSVGKIGKWPAWVLEHCRVITDMTRKGRRLVEIRELFGSDWPAIARRYRRYNLGEIMAREAAEEVDSLVESLGKLQQELLQLKPDDVAALYVEADKLFHLKPVLVITADGGAQVLSEERANLISSLSDAPVITKKFWHESDYV